MGDWSAGQIADAVQPFFVAGVWTTVVSGEACLANRWAMKWSFLVRYTAV